MGVERDCAVMGDAEFWEAARAGLASHFGASFDATAQRRLFYQQAAGMENELVVLSVEEVASLKAQAAAGGSAAAGDGDVPADGAGDDEPLDDAELGDAGEPLGDALDDAAAAAHDDELCEARRMIGALEGRLALAEKAAFTSDVHAPPSLTGPPDSELTREGLIARYREITKGYSDRQYQQLNEWSNECRKNAVLRGQLRQFRAYGQVDDVVGTAVTAAATAEKTAADVRKQWAAELKEKDETIKKLKVKVSKAGRDAINQAAISNLVRKMKVYKEKMNECVAAGMPFAEAVEKAEQAAESAE
jgi:hypothetical protein